MVVEPDRRRRLASAQQVTGRPDLAMVVVVVVVVVVLEQSQYSLRTHARREIEGQ